MTFEERLTGAFDTLTERLRGEVEEEVQRRAFEIAAAAAAAPPAPAEPAPADERPGFDPSSAGRLLDGMRRIDAARSLTGVLDALVTAARSEAASADIWLSRGGRRHHWRAPGSDEAAQETPSGSLVVPIAIAGSEVAFLYADVGDAGTTYLEQRTANVQLLARYAARSLEALTAFKTARALTQRAGAGAGPSREIVDGANGVDGASGEEEISARRYARLLVSEIKLYHEPAVIDGRRDRDLATRLGGEITRARVMYEERVPTHVRERADYFHDELVRTLADGDAGLFG
ncbi:MAG TPA: hypothetical protein VHT95_09230 [Vicinamibacterales bacterium]|nr:hypothetical protein [Vicinamibacterales bacterium]